MKLLYQLYLKMRGRYCEQHLLRQSNPIISPRQPRDENFALSSVMSLFHGIILLIGLLLLWQLTIIIFQLPPYILPTPFSVIHTTYLRMDLIINESSVTIIETLLGLLLGILLGCTLSLTMAFSRFISLWLLPLLIISQALPTFAIAPLLVIWFGYGMTSKIVTTILMVFFPIASSFYDGLRKTNTGWLDLAKTMNAKKWRIFLYIRVPAAFPSLASGIRVATVAAPIGAVIGEWVGANQGLGYLILNANARMQIDLMFAALLVLVIFSLLLYFIVDKMLTSCGYTRYPGERF